MKKMKSVLFASLFLAGTMALAQQNPGSRPVNSGEPNQKPEQFILEQLNLSDQQKLSLDKIQKEYDQKDSIALIEFNRSRGQEQLNRINDFKRLLNKDQQDKLDDYLLMHADHLIFDDGHNPESKLQGYESPDQQHSEYIGQENSVKSNIKTDVFSKNLKGKDLKNSKKDARKDGKHKGKHSGKHNKGKQEEKGVKSNVAPVVKVEMQEKKLDKFKLSGLTPEAYAQKQTTGLIKALYLNGPQANQVQKINLKYALMKSEHVDIKKGVRHNEIRAVLDDQQRAEYNALLSMEY